MIRSERGDLASATGQDIREGGCIVLPDEEFRARNVVGYDGSDLHLVSLEPIT